MAGKTHLVQQLLASIVRCYLSLRPMFFILILSWCELTAIGQLTLSPMMVAPVCLGGQVNLICTAQSVEFLEWSFTVVNEQGRDEPFTVFSTSRGPSQQSLPIVVNSTNFTVIRNSGERVLPLISTLSISSVSIGLNGTVMTCMDPRNTLISASTTIQIIDTSQNQYTPILHITSEEYLADNVTVTVEWAQQVGPVYTARVSPLVSILFTGATSRQLTILYNTAYNLSVVAVTPCWPNTTAFIRLNYANCEYPNLLPSIGNNSAARIEGYDGLSIEGSTVRFSCPPGLMLIGPNSATCTENGEWEPDPSGVMCNDSKVMTCGHPFRDRRSGDNGSIIVMGYMDPAIEGATIVFECPPKYILKGPNATTCMENGEWKPDPREVECKGFEEKKIEESRSKYDPVLRAAISSTVVVFVVISFLTFVAGFACGHYFGRKRTKATSSQPIALYEDVNVLPSAAEHQEQHLELRENVAYGPLKLKLKEQH